MEKFRIPDNYEYKFVTAKGKDGENSMCIEIAIENCKEFSDWLTDFSQLNNVCYRKERGNKSRQNKLELLFICHHGKMGQKGIKTTDTK